ncbi:SulA-like leucine-rich domain-containing protein [Kistimonas asteriae]|uniref:SulA-like leucine-rich domain-containing protein n=1 Tax=Kistimonas asteriae TaxID=517724 RepID=UPI001BA7034F|nr:SulA-like leucine-rich domain-containing protein [Kistimonas asteriae]
MMYSMIQPQTLHPHEIGLPQPSGMSQGAYQQDRPYGHVNEVIAPAFSSLSICLITPILSQLTRNHDDRWLTLIASSAFTSEISHWLKNADLNTNKLLLLTADTPEQALNLACRALSSGNSHTVVAWINDLSEQGLEKLERAAILGKSDALAIRGRKATSQQPALPDFFSAACGR